MRLWLPILFMLKLLLILRPVSSSEDDLVSISIPPSCDIVSECERCPADAVTKECSQTGYVHRLKCEKNSNSTGNEDIVITVPCVPPIESWKEMLRFILLMCLGSFISLLIVRRRKQLAKQNLVSLVNRS